MYCYFHPYLLYGVREGNRNAVLEEEWLLDTFDPDGNLDLDIYASDVVRNIMGNAVYGFRMTLDSTTGQAQPPTNEQKQCIQTLYERLCNYWSAVGRRQEEDLALMTPEEKQEHEDKINRMMPKMGYFLVVSGDYNTEVEHESYTPTAEDEEDDDEEENEQDENKQEEKEEEEEEEKEEEEEEEEENEKEESKRRRTE